MSNVAIKSVGQYVVYQQLKSLPDGETHVTGYLVVGPGICRHYDDEADAVAAAQSRHEEHPEQAHQTPHA